MTTPWPPDACTLPTAERPLRVAESDTVFARGLLDFHRHAPGLLRLVLACEVERDLNDLIARETKCCSFFTFTTRREGERLTVDIEVPPDQETVLDALTARLAGREPPASVR